MVLHTECGVLLTLIKDLNGRIGPHEGGHISFINEARNLFTFAKVFAVFVIQYSVQKLGIKRNEK
jgi:hypothetical protein